MTHATNLRLQTGQHVEPNQKGAQEISESAKLEEFIYLVSHDVRACLRALIEVPRWIKEDLEDEGHPITDTFEQNFNLLETNTGRLDRMMEDLLIYSRIGRMQGSSTASIERALRAVNNKLDYPETFSIKSNLEVDRLLMGSEDLERLLWAVLSNCIKHIDQECGEIFLMSELVGNYARLQISDNGPGIERQYLEKVIEPMTTLKPRDEVEGSGMGLAITNKVAQFYGGELSLSAGLDGCGLGVTVLLPVVDQDYLSV